MSSASVDQEKLDRAQEALWIKQIKDAYEYLKAGKNEKYQQSRDEATHTVRLFFARCRWRSHASCFELQVLNMIQLIRKQRHAVIFNTCKKFHEEICKPQFKKAVAVRAWKKKRAEAAEAGKDVDEMEKVNLRFHCVPGTLITTATVLARSHRSLAFEPT